MEIRFEQNLISIPIINYKLPLPATTAAGLLQFCLAELKGVAQEGSESDDQWLESKRLYTHAVAASIDQLQPHRYAILLSE